MSEKAIVKVSQAAPTPEQLAVFHARRHPKYDEMIAHWRFLISCYKGGRAWFVENITSHLKESTKEFKERQKRAYRLNHTREAVSLVQKYLFKAPATRNTTDAHEVVTKFWSAATLAGQSVDQLMRSASTANSVCGRVAVVVDNNYVAEPDARPISEREAEDRNIRAYAYIVQAPDILDYAFDEDGDGELLWIKLREFYRNDKDPMLSDGDTVVRVRLWTRHSWSLYEEEDLPIAVQARNNAVRKAAPSKTLRLIQHEEHTLGFVPVKLFDHIIGDDPYEAQSLIDDIAYLDLKIANYLSNLDAIIQDQTFSQLAIPAQSIVQGDDKMQKIMEMGTKRLFVYDGNSASAPHYLSPDPKQAGVIITVINKLIAEIYNTIGLAGERTKEDNAVGIDNSSGVAKAYDFERVNSLLLAKAQSCELVENWIVKTVLAWHDEPEPKEKMVTYPETFDVMRLADELVTAEALGKLLAPVEVRREQMRALVSKLFPQASKELKAKLEADIAKWLNDVDALAQQPKIPGATKPVSAPSRQGSVTKDTPAKG